MLYHKSCCFIIVSVSPTGSIVKVLDSQIWQKSGFFFVKRENWCSRNSISGRISVHDLYPSLVCLNLVNWRKSWWVLPFTDVAVVVKIVLISEMSWHFSSAVSHRNTYVHVLPTAIHGLYKLFCIVKEVPELPWSLVLVLLNLVITVLCFNSKEPSTCILCAHSEIKMFRCHV